VEEQQSVDWEAVERSSNGEILQQRYHITLHYERITEDASKFEAIHNTILGNTVVENATIAVIKVDEGLPLKPIVRHGSI
jgi:phosphoribosylformylglycinamidine (FGAM) synthase PurS component